MKIQISSFEIGKSVEALHEWNKLALTIDLLPGQDPIEAHKEAKALLDRLLPGMDSGRGEPVEESPVNNRIASLIEDINACTEIDRLNQLNIQVGLIAFKDLSETNPELKAAYDLRLKQLQK